MKIIVSLNKISIWDTENERGEGGNYAVCETSLSLEMCQGKLTNFVFVYTAILQQRR